VGLFPGVVLRNAEGGGQGGRSTKPGGGVSVAKGGGQGWEARKSMEIGWGYEREERQSRTEELLINYKVDGRFDTCVPNRKKNGQALVLRKRPREI